jgi:Fe-S cluster assembly protein SufD
MKPAALPDIAELVGTADAARGWLDDAAVRLRLEERLPGGLTRELWKYTPIRGFLDAMADSTGAPLPALGNADQGGIRALPLDALEAADEQQLRQIIAERLDAARHPVADLALLRARGGWFIDVTGDVEKPLEIHYPAHGIAPVFLVVRDNASLQVVEHIQADGFIAQVSHVELGRGARLTHHRTALQSRVPHYALLSVRLGGDAAYELNHNCLGGTRRRSEVHVVLDGPGASVDMAGAYLVEDGQHLDQQYVVEHRAGDTRSRQKFHGIGAGKGRSVFNGRIHIHRHAARSDAALSNKNLALHAGAEMNTKPELEIYTDDVRCAHGATVGQMSEDGLFYLTARGIPEAEARMLLAYGFVRECMHGPLADAAARRFREALA